MIYLYIQIESKESTVYKDNGIVHISTVLHSDIYNM